VIASAASASSAAQLTAILPPCAVGKVPPRDIWPCW
jgi:hypothetical protein